MNTTVTYAIIPTDNQPPRLSFRGPLRYSATGASLATPLRLAMSRSTHKGDAASPTVQLQLGGS